MTDITELAQSLKAAAEKATQGNWRAFQYHDGRCGIGGGHNAEIMVCEHISKERPHDAMFIALANPANVLALVEALEKAQRANAAQDDHINQQQDRIESLEKKNAELGKYAGGLESFRTAYMEWSDKTDWVQTDKRFDFLKPWGKHRADVLKAYIEHLESRTVKLPKKNIGWDRDEEDCWNNAIDACAEVLAAAGIKVEAE
ncbi:ead/Ea22-like family protein [Klebsiella pneumoniae]|uniref:ead/Ea22-like family protein n=1 Tax=Klebsiella pneumoniae TaxID=573 RepID=UPI000695AB9F|nr:ead/Ea22-like family protein [Klebsiella pneumoniae]MCD4577926.1 ead/Ea22-like family protein [Klebsiella pneumoniae]MCE0398636.1 ead/Ea22-like family protein [Klebsiella pneumoniae]UDD19095.1 ead/Ea22-like family protein [Klebsiella pneumoniae]URC03886.1 ead/Ea22-like family protein [Klebsiella pneumoniae]WFB29443.1 ead/Ea22-like family protein [Klebsiella pneumoniae]